MRGGKRGRLEVISDILSSTRNSATKTQICQETNMSFEMGGKYLNLMVGNDLIGFEKIQEGQVVGRYLITNKGFDFLNGCHSLKKLISER